MATPALAAAREQAAMAHAPTLDDIRRWPATVSVPTACRAYGISRSHGYELVRIGEFPARTVKVGSAIRVVTASIVADLERVGDGAA
jgi:predicted DNA-binding transcriptional regulator AlpA